MLNLTYSPLQVSLVTASALLAAVIGLLALLRRGHWLVTLLFSSAFLSMAAFQAGTVGHRAGRLRGWRRAPGPPTWPAGLGAGVVAVAGAQRGAGAARPVEADPRRGRLPDAGAGGLRDPVGRRRQRRGWCAR